MKTNRTFFVYMGCILLTVAAIATPICLGMLIEKSRSKKIEDKIEPQKIEIKNEKPLPKNTYNELREKPPSFELVSVSDIRMSYAHYMSVLVLKDKETEKEYILVNDTRDGMTITPRIK